ncbi:MAG: hypothetical protein V4578_21515 [Pseudomonadota bacterium]
MNRLAQAANIARFAGKLPANARSTMQFRPLPNGGIAAQATSAGRVTGSFAVYEKQIDENGNSVQFTKTTYDPFGTIINVKDKIHGGVVP